MLLTEEQINKVVEKINEKINLPLIGEKAETVIFRFAVKKVLTFLEEHLPEELKALINDVADGISNEEAKAITDRFVRFMNADIDFPILNEGEEAIIFEIVVGLIIESMIINKNINKTINSLNV